MEELQDVVRSTEGLLRVIGRGHSYSPVCEVEGGTMVSLARLSKVLSYTPPSPSGTSGTISFEGGTTLSQLCYFLASRSPQKVQQRCLGGRHTEILFLQM